MSDNIDMPQIGGIEKRESLDMGKKLYLMDRVGEINRFFLGRSEPTDVDRVVYDLIDRRLGVDAEVKLAELRSKLDTSTDYEITVSEWVRDVESFLKKDRELFDNK